MCYEKQVCLCIVLAEFGLLDNPATRSRNK